MYSIFEGNCLDVIKELIAQGVEVDSIVTDPPYELGFMNKDWDKSGIAYNKELWELCLKILKPGGHLLSFGGSRTYHRMASAIEDAGFEIRDQIMWIYGSGFPKSLDVSKAIDKAAGAERKVLNIAGKSSSKRECMVGDFKGGNYFETEPATNDAKQWQGFGTALKPAHEPIVLARKPLSEKTIAANVLKHGTGAINIDECRVGYNGQSDIDRAKGRKKHYEKIGRESSSESSVKIMNPLYKGEVNQLGRFPANLIHDGSDEVEAEFAKYGERKSGEIRPHHITRNKKENSIYEPGLKEIAGRSFIASTGTASRFYYCAKASKSERNGSKHPTVKPLALMRYLCRLITPPGGLILDPFAGSGTTGQAANQEGFAAILIEKNKEYISDIEKRLNQETQMCFAEGL